VRAPEGCDWSERLPQNAACRKLPGRKMWPRGYNFQIMFLRVSAVLRPLIA